MIEWDVVEEKAIRNDGSLYFPERLSQEFLDSAKRVMGTYLWNNQYQNICIPDDAQDFKRGWNRYYQALPTNTYRFCFVDPAIGQLNHHDFTGIVIVDVDSNGTWYVRVANRYRLTPSQIVNKLFQIQHEMPCQVIGIEQVAYQEALLYMLDSEMRMRNVILPVKGITRGAKSKHSRILGLVPRFEWGRLFLNQGLNDLELELAQFPRGTFDDILDALASIDEIAFKPDKETVNDESRIKHPHEPGYESQYIRELARGSEGADVSSIYASPDSGPMG